MFLNSIISLQVISKYKTKKKPRNRNMDLYDDLIETQWENKGHPPSDIAVVGK